MKFKNFSKSVIAILIVMIAGFVFIDYPSLDARQGRLRPGCLCPFTFFQHAVMKGDVEQLKLFLEAGADPNEKDDGLGDTPLCLASRKNKAKVVKLLLAAGADPNAENDGGQTPLDITQDDKIRELLKNAMK